jgi:phage terminase large subunit-like protein
VNYEYVAEYLRRIWSSYDIRTLAFDRWHFNQLKQWLLKAGFKEAELEQRFISFGQGFQSMSPALRALEEEIRDGRMAHGNHAVLSMCAAHAVVVSDSAKNKKLDKSKSTGRIDGLVALAMAIGAVPSAVEAPKHNIFFI